MHVFFLMTEELNLSVQQFQMVVCQKQKDFWIEEDCCKCNHCQCHLFFLTFIASHEGFFKCLQDILHARMCLAILIAFENAYFTWQYLQIQIPFRLNDFQCGNASIVISFLLREKKKSSSMLRAFGSSCRTPGQEVEAESIPAPQEPPPRPWMHRPLAL